MATQLTVDRQFRKLEISDELIKIKFVEIITQPSSHPENDNKITARKFSVESEDEPHQDLVVKLKHLKAHVFAINEMELIDKKEKSQYSVNMVQVDGDVFLQKSRVKFGMRKEVDRNGKYVGIGPTGQVTMFGESDYPEHEKMSAIVKELIDEVWLYLSGKYADETPGQLPLFSPLQMANLI